MKQTPSKYRSQRPKVTPPHVSLRTVRAIAGMTLDEVCELISEHLGRPFTRGALSAIEGGHRGASADVIEALAHAYGVLPEDIDTNYEPRIRSAAA